MYECPVCATTALDRPPYEIWPPPAGVEIFPPYGEMLGMPSYDVCPSCAYEFGFEDNPRGDAWPVSFAEYRDEWVREGRPLFEDGRFMPDGAFCVIPATETNEAATRT
jgi:hypothetical protein